MAILSMSTRKKVETPAKKVVTNHIDIKTGKKIADEEDGNKPKKDIPGYRFVETKDDNGNTNHYYEQVKTFYKDKDGNDILPPEDGSNPKKDIPGYRFVETKDDNGNTIHVYEQVMTTFVDEQGNKLLDPKKGEHPKEDIKDYEFVKTNKKPNGDIEHVYKKKAATPKALPKTGQKQDHKGLMAVVIAGIAGIAGFFGFKNMKKEDE